MILKAGKFWEVVEECYGDQRHVNTGEGLKSKITSNILDGFQLKGFEVN